MKRIISAMTALVLCVCLFSFAGTGASDNTADAADCIYSAMTGCETLIDISDYDIDAEKLSGIMKSILNEFPELFHYTGTYAFSRDINGKVTEVEPRYSLSLSEYKERLAAVDAEVSALTEIIPDGASDFEKALLMHDAIAAKYEYDLDYTVRDIYNFVKWGKGVCQGYAYFYAYVLRSVGIDCDFVISEEMNHMWNIVKVGGEWYNVDVTYDDPVGSNDIPSFYGKADHLYFMRSDENFLYHKGGVKLYECTSQKYDKYKYSDGSSPYGTWGSSAIVPFRGKYYVYADGGLFTYNPANDKLTSVLPREAIWRPWYDDVSYYNGTYSGLSLYNGSLIFNDAKHVYAYNPIACTISELYSRDYWNDVGDIFGSYAMPDGTLRVILSKGINGEWKSETAKIGSTDGALVFADVTPKKWFYKDVKEAVARGLFNGVSTTEFAPDTAMERGMLVTVIYRMEGSPSVDGIENPFTDVGNKKYYADAVKWAYKNGIVNGMTETEFAPTGKITREQLAAILCRYESYKNGSIGDIDTAGAKGMFADWSDVSSYAKKSLAWAYEKGLVNGIANGSTLNVQPQGNATRAQVAAILVRYLTANK